MERANAVVLLQRCLRGRAAQVLMEEARVRNLELYEELNELDDRPIPPKSDQACADNHEMLAIKVHVGERLRELFSSLLVTEIQP